MEDQGGPGYWGSYKYQDKINILIMQTEISMRQSFMNSCGWKYIPTWHFNFIIFQVLGRKRKKKAIIEPNVSHGLEPPHLLGDKASRLNGHYSASWEQA